MIWLSVRKEGEVESLSELKAQHSKLKKAIQNDKASHDFYLAMWKSAPYAIIAMFPVSAYAYLASAGSYFVGAILATGAVSGVGLYGWHTQKKLNGQIAQSEIELEETEKKLERRIAKVEAQFINSRPSTYLVSLDNISFDQRLEEVRLPTFRYGIVPQLQRDMEFYDSDLMTLLDELDSTVKDEHGKLVKYCRSAKEAIAEVLTPEEGQVNQNPDIMAMRVGGLYLVLCGMIGSGTVLEGANKPYEVARMQKEGIGFVRMLFANEDKNNRTPALLRNTGLKESATDSEGARKKAEGLKTTIEHILKVKFEETPYRPGI